jgi:hypothetical protein
MMSDEFFPVKQEEACDVGLDLDASDTGVSEEQPNCHTNEGLTEELHAQTKEAIKRFRCRRIRKDH